MPSLSFSVPSLRDAILSGRKRCTTRPFRNLDKADNDFAKRHRAKEYQLFWKLRTKETERLVNVIPTKMVCYPNLQVRGPAVPIFLYSPHHDIPHPCYAQMWCSDGVWDCREVTPFNAYDTAMWVYREGFNSMDELYDALHGFYDEATMRGLFYVVWWAWPPPAEQPDDAVWRGSD